MEKNKEKSEVGIYQHHKILAPGDVLCSTCNGFGWTTKDSCTTHKGEVIPLKHSFRELCWRCGGVGKFDWIENITQNGK